MPTSKSGHFYYSWFPTIYQSATQHLSLAEDGAYRRLIDYYMITKSPLLDNDVALARIVGVGRDEWDAIKATVKSYFKPSVNPLGYLIHEFCDSELQLHDARMTKASVNGKKGGRPKSMKTNDKKPVAKLNVTQQKAEHNITEVKEEESNDSSKIKRAKVGLDDLTVEHIAPWLAEKRAQGQHLTTDPAVVLEGFKDYCKSKGKKYADYIAAYRNAFGWERFARGNAGQTQIGDRGAGVRATGHNQPTKTDRVNAILNKHLDRINAEGIARGEIDDGRGAKADDDYGHTMLPGLEDVR